MSVRSGRILFVGNTYLIDRIQTAGPSNLNIPQETVKEVGNYKSVGIMRDRADLSFDLEQLDMTTEVEAILTGIDPTTVSAGTAIDFSSAKPIDIIAPFKDQGGLFTTVAGIATPYLSLESASYRFGIRQNAAQTFTLRGDSIYYIPGTPYQEVFTAAGPVAGPYTLAHTALNMDESGDSFYVLGLCLYKSSGAYERLFYGVDFTDSATTFTLTATGAAKVDIGDKIHAVYGSAAPATYAQSVHPLASTKPAAVRHANIDVYVGPQGGTLTRWPGVQSAEATWRVTYDTDEEFGNSHIVSRDYDTPEVSGTVGVRPKTAGALFSLISEITSRPTNEVAGVLSFVPLEMEIHVSSPADGTRLKTIYVPDAVIQPPPIQPRVSSQLDVSLPFTSETGSMKVYAGARP